MNILVLLKNAPLDRSIVNFTTALFKGTEAKLHLLNIVEVNGEVPVQRNGKVLDDCTEFDLSGYIATAANNKSYLETIQSELITARHAFVGHRIRLVKNYIQENSIHLLVGGAHKTSRAEDLFINTFAASIIREIDQPFLTIKCNRDHFAPKNIGIIRDFIRPVKENLEIVKRIAEMHQSQLKLIKIKTTDEKRSNETIYEKMNAFTAMNDLNASPVIIENTTKEQGINALIDEHLIDLIVLDRGQPLRFSAPRESAENTTLVNHLYTPILIH